MSGNWYFDGEGCQGGNEAAVIIVTSSDPWEDTLGDSSWFPSVPASEESAVSLFLLFTYSAEAEMLLTESTSTPQAPLLPVL